MGIGHNYRILSLCKTTTWNGIKMRACSRTFFTGYKTWNEMRLMTKHAFELENRPLSACEPHTYSWPTKYGGKKSKQIFLDMFSVFVLLPHVSHFSLCVLCLVYWCCYGSGYVKPRYIVWPYGRTHLFFQVLLQATQLDLYIFFFFFYRFCRFAFLVYFIFCVLFFTSHAYRLMKSVHTTQRIFFNRISYAWEKNNNKYRHFSTVR